MLENDKLTLIKNDVDKSFHVISNKIGELGLIFFYDTRFVFKPFGSEKFFKSWHLANILKEMNKLNKK